MRCEIKLFSLRRLDNQYLCTLRRRAQSKAIWGRSRGQEGGAYEGAPSNAIDDAVSEVHNNNSR